MHNQAVEHNVGCVFRALLCCTLAGKAEVSTTSNSANLMSSC